jgi:hypothetical protein
MDFRVPGWWLILYLLACITHFFFLWALVDRDMMVIGNHRQTSSGSGFLDYPHTKHLLTS